MKRRRRRNVIMPSLSLPSFADTHVKCYSSIGLLHSNGSTSILGCRRYRSYLFLAVLFSVAVPVSRAEDVTSGTSDGSEKWGYIDVRQGAHMFWWLYKTPSPTKSPWPLLLWLQGGPGASGVGYGSFEEIGPLTVDMTPRNFTWLEKAHLLFVDSPVGTGYSYVDDSSLLLRTDEDVAVDILTFLKKFFEKYEELQKCPLFLVAESYGGKHATLLGLLLNKAIQSGDINATLGGVALGDTWISPVDFVLTWGPILRYFSRVDEYQEQQINSLAETIQYQVNNGSYYDAYLNWYNLEYLVYQLSNGVDFYNLLLDGSEDNTLSLLSLKRRRHFPYFTIYPKKLMLIEDANEATTNLTYIMNGPVRDKLQIIPANLTWESIATDVFYSLTDVFMKDVISKVDELLLTGINVTIYSGQLDLICSTLGTENWVKKLNWTDLSSFQNADRIPLYCGGTGATRGFMKSFNNLAFYWILLAGHMVPYDNPCTGFQMIGQVLNT